MVKNTKSRIRVVIVGVGFAALSAIKELSKEDIDVVLVDRDPYSTFQPFLYQVATGGLNPGDVTVSARAFSARYPRVRFVRGHVTGIHKQDRELQLKDGRRVPYDYLIISAGVGPNFFGIPGAPENATTIYTRAESLHVRDRVMQALELVAEKHPDAPEPVFVVVGGGATGVEMAGALAELRSTAVPLAYPGLNPERVRIVLVEMLDHLLSPFDEKLQKYTAEALRKRGVELRLNTAVKEVRPDSVVIGDDEELPTAVTIWASGVTTRDEVSNWGLEQGKGGRIRVHSDLRTGQDERIFAAGDIALIDDQALPQLAQPAIQMGRHAARQIRKLVNGEPTEGFEYKDRGIMATIGRSAAVVQLPSGIKLKGFTAWVAWLLLHIYTLMGGRNRVSAMANLSVRYLTWKRSANVIVGDPPTRRG